MSRRDTAISAKSLACLLQGLQGSYTTIELRNETSIFGLIDNADGEMNTFLTDVTVTQPDDKAEQFHFDSYFVKGRHIRYVHIPDHMDIIKTLEKQVKLFNKRPEQSKPKEPSISVMQSRKLREQLQVQKLQGRGRSKPGPSGLGSPGTSGSGTSVLELESDRKPSGSTEKS